jgi:hypothetical protein
MDMVPHATLGRWLSGGIALYLLIETPQSVVPGWAIDTLPEAAH